MRQFLGSLINEWWTRPLPEVLPRRVDLLSYVNLPIRKAITVVGFRRVGKTFLLLNLAKKIGQQNCLYINFEDERIEKKTTTLTLLLDVLTELKGKKSYILLLDEIQNIPGWSLWVRRVLETTSHQVFLSGSSSKLSSSQIATELRGRSFTLYLSPLSFKEFLVFKKKKPQFLPEAEILHLLREYLIYGGFPEIALSDEGKKTMIIDEYFQTFLGRDLMERYKIRHQEELRVLIKLLFHSSFYTSSSITNTLRSIFNNLSKSTVIRYLSFLEESLFLKNLFVFRPSIKNRLQAPKKPYFVDNFFLSRFSSDFSHNLGRLMEQAVFHHLWEQKTTSSDSFDFYYWKDYADREVDFILRKNEQILMAIQASFVSDKLSINPREVKSLIKASEIFLCQDLRLITFALEGELKVKDKSIKLIPLWRYLLTED